MGWEFQGVLGGAGGVKLYVSDTAPASFAPFWASTARRSRW